jgi:hypothetical protein
LNPFKFLQNLCNILWKLCKSQMVPSTDPSSRLANPSISLLISMSFFLMSIISHLMLTTFFLIKAIYRGPLTSDTCSCPISVYQKWANKLFNMFVCRDFPKQTLYNIYWPILKSDILYAILNKFISKYFSHTTGKLRNS